MLFVLLCLVGKPCLPMKIAVADATVIVYHIAVDARTIAHLHQCRPTESESSENSQTFVGHFTTTSL